MFSNLKNELILYFNLKTESPLFINSGEDNSLNPSAVDGTYLSTYKNGKLEPFIPGTSLKGAFRCRAERLIENACDIVAGRDCLNEKEEKKAKTTGYDRYVRSCPVCRLFGSKVLRSRITFSDCFVKGKYTTGERTCVGINRVTGAAKKGALYNMQYIENAVFEGKITIQNFEPYQLNLILYLFNEMSEGFITLGSMTSKGFGNLKGQNFILKVRYYGNNNHLEGYEDKGYYKEKVIEGYSNILELVKDIDFTKISRGGEVDEQAI